MTLSKSNHAIALKQAEAETTAEMEAAFLVWLEYVALDELAEAQITTAKKTADARDSKRAEAIVAARKVRGGVLR